MSSAAAGWVSFTRPSRLRSAEWSRLKVLRFGVVADQDAMQRFQREAETVARLHHTNIVPIFAVGCERGVHYYAMQYIAGRSLADVLAESQRSGKPCSCDDVARWGLQAAEALRMPTSAG